ncbi:MAG: DNA polymerase III subunit alpha, partial [Gammaproteobacteria bacterium]|nr:DNA polymerase III subunit alpha [Gammaproteobacteria bacterium]
DFPVPEGMDVNSFLQAQSRKGLEERLKKILDPDDPDYESKAKVYFDRLEFELDVIIQMGFPGYFLIVADFIQWAKDHLIPVGPGRGSGAGSLVAYVLTITDLDPIALELLFERFLNPERVSMPDFDVDFCMEQRDRVIDYVAERYGRDKVSQIITYGSMAAKAVVRDVGRVLSHPYGFVDRIAKLIPFEVGITLKQALEQEKELQQLYDDDEDVKALLDLAQSLEGLARNAGKHAGGVVISPTKLTDFTPIYCEQGGANIVSQFDKDDVEAVGLVKFDFLGLRTLTIIDWAVQTINAQRKNNNEEPLDISIIPVDDKASFDLLKRHATTAVFQLESRGMKDLIKRLQPDHFDDIVALVALFRPGPLQSGMVDDFIERKHGRAKVEYPHPALEPILKPTYGVILYQEQVMQIAQVLALYSLGEADLLRRAMGKKKPEEMAKQRSIFTEGAVKNNVEEKTATYIFDLMEKFAGYGFNKSHSAAYALVSYQTTWLKAHYPSAFMSAVLSSDMDNTDKVVTLIEECRDMHLNVLSPNVNKSFYMFTSHDDDTIIYGLGAIKGVGQAAIEIIYEERETNGEFKDLFDFCKRVDLRKVNKRVLEAMVRAGAVDELGLNRASLMAQLPDAVRAAEQCHRNASVGMDDLFGEAAPDSGEATLTVVEVEDWDDETRLTAEKETLGLYLTGHPIARYEEELSSMITARVCDLMAGSGGQDVSNTFRLGSGQEKEVIAAGLVIGVRVINTRRGRMAIVTIDDRTGRMDITLFSELFESARSMIVKDKVMVVKGKLSLDDYTGDFRLNAEAIFSMDMAREHFARRLVINIDQSKGRNGFVQSLAEVLGPFKEGRCPIWVQYQGDSAQVKLPLGTDWRVHPTDELLHRLRSLADESQVWMEYTV